MAFKLPLLEICARNKPLPTLPLYLTRIQVRLIIFKNCQRQIILTVTRRVNAMKKKKIHTEFGRKLITIQIGSYFIFRLLIVIFTFQISILLY